MLGGAQPPMPPQGMPPGMPPQGLPQLMPPQDGPPPDAMGSAGPPGMPPRRRNIRIAKRGPDGRASEFEIAED